MVWTGLLHALGLVRSPELSHLRVLSTSRSLRYNSASDS